MIVYVNGDATRPRLEGPKLIVHVCNDCGGWGAGFVLAISKRWKQPERSYREWSREPYGFELGAVQIVDVEPGVAVANMIAQSGLVHRTFPPIRYEALASCLTQVRAVAIERGASVHMPRIGCGLAGGTWERVGPIVESCLREVPVVVYDFEPPR